MSARGAAPGDTDGTAGLGLADALDLSGLSWVELWLRYVGVGGTRGTAELQRIVALDTDPYEHNLLAVALNEYFVDREQYGPVGYRPSSVVGSGDDPVG